jgi:hypothetical protein
MEVQGTKYCRDCQTERPLEDFHPTQPYCKPCMNVRWSKWYNSKEHEYKRKRRLKINYGITHEEYESMFEARDGLCDICKRPESFRGTLLSVDHDHETGKIRGLLCNNCNRALGLIGDSLEQAQRMVSYLERDGS